MCVKTSRGFYTSKFRYSHIVNLYFSAEMLINAYTKKNALVDGHFKCN